MASIADVFVTVLPETSKIADGIQKALRQVDDDVRRAAKRWSKDIERELGEVDVTVGADTRKAEKELDRLEREKHTATADVKVDQASVARASKTVKSVGSRRWHRPTRHRFRQHRRRPRQCTQTSDHHRRNLVGAQPGSRSRLRGSARSVTCRACWGCCPRWPVREM